MENNTAALNEELQCSTEQMTEQNDYSSLKLGDIVALLEKLVEQEDHTELYKKAEVLKSIFYRTLHRERQQLLCDQQNENVMEDDAAEVSNEALKPFVDLEERFKSAFQNYKRLMAVVRREQEAEREENYSKKLQIIEELKALIEKTEDINKTIPEFRELQNRWKQTGAVPQEKLKDLWETYQLHTERFYDYIKLNNEFRDLDFKKNLEAKTAICDKAESLDKEPNVIKAFKELHKLHDEWKEIGPVAKEYRDSIWERFKTLSTIINKKHQSYFDNLKAEQNANFDAKNALCEKAEELVEMAANNPSEFASLSDKMDELHAEWKKTGFAAKKDNQKLYDRFCEACNKFYTAKRAYYNSVKSAMAENLKRKFELCEEAEALMNSEEWKKTADKIILLQKKWKEIGPTTRRRSDDVWKRFRKACDTFFERRNSHYEEERLKYEENIRLKKELLAELQNFEIKDDKTENISAMRAFRERWNAIGYVPSKERGKLQSEYDRLADAKFNDIRSAENSKALNRFKKTTTDIKSSGKGSRSLWYERERLVEKYRKTEQNIATLENNMGFFAKSKNAESYIRDIERNIAVLREELETIEQKIKIIENQFE